MQYTLVYHDLLTVPLGRRNPGIFWLRLYATSQRDHVAVVTEVPGNPSSSVTNCVSRIAYSIERRFGIPPGRLVLYEVWPQGSPADNPGIRRVDLGEAPDWANASKADIEAIIGCVLMDLPSHDELYRRVLALGGGAMREVFRSVFEAVPVADLPPPAFLATLTRRDLRRCEFHKARWKDIADESVRVIEALGRRDAQDYVEAAQHAHLRRDDLRWLVSLFADPIVVKDHSYTDGQHRGCALRFSGAHRAAVITGEEYLGEVSADWTYEGEG